MKLLILYFITIIFSINVLAINVLAQDADDFQTIVCQQNVCYQLKVDIIGGMAYDPDTGDALVVNLMLSSNLPIQDFPNQEIIERLMNADEDFQDDYISIRRYIEGNTEYRSLCQEIVYDILRCFTLTRFDSE